VLALVVVREVRDFSDVFKEPWRFSLPYKRAKMGNCVCADNVDLNRLGGIWKGHTAFLHHSQSCVLVACADTI